MFLLFLILFIIGFFGTKFIIPYFKALLVDNDILRKNYMKELIPVSMGIAFLPMLIINSIVIRYFFSSNNDIYIYLFGLISMCFLGILDDLIGDRQYSGLKGHFKALLNKKLTTGALKALFGGFVSLLIAISISKNIVDIIINTLTIALFTNFINLLDLRPGRAIKGYLFVSFITFLFVPVYSKILIIILASCVIAYFRDDLKAKAMMGDAGSNVLGISLGIINAMSFDSTNYPTKVSILCFLIIIHIITEKYSLTEIIEKNSFLNYIDKLGR